MKVLQHGVFQEQQRPPIQPRHKVMGEQYHKHMVLEQPVQDHDTYDGTKSLLRTILVMKLFEYSAKG